MTSNFDAITAGLGTLARAIGLALLLTLIGCNTVAPRGELDAACSGVPGDPLNPGRALPAAAPTHGPNAPQQPRLLRAIARPATSDSIPWLYVFDDQGDPLFSGPDSPLGGHDSAFAEAEAQAYWGELVDNRYYRIPWLGPCEIASMLAQPPPLRGPAGGLLFVQFVLRDCAECDRLSTAIQQLHRSQPTRPLIWLQIEVDGAMGRRISED